jgi:hypothetical protein
VRWLHSIPSRLLPAVGVVQERFECAHPLDQPWRQGRPVLRCDDARHQIQREQPVRLIVGHPERHAPRSLLGSQRGHRRGHTADLQPVQHPEHPAIVRQNPAIGPDRLVVASSVVTGIEVAIEQGRRGRHHGRRVAVQRLTASLRDQIVNHVGELAAPAEHPALTGRGAARGKGSLGQLEHLFPVAGCLQLRPQFADQPFDEPRRRYEGRPGRVGKVDEITFQPGPGRPPGRCPQQLVTGLGQ